MGTCAGLFAIVSPSQTAHWCSWPAFSKGFSEGGRNDKTRDWCPGIHILVLWTVQLAQVSQEMVGGRHNIQFILKMGDVSETDVDTIWKGAKGIAKRLWEGKDAPHT